MKHRGSFPLRYDARMPAQLSLLTPATPGAIALIQVQGGGAGEVLKALTGKSAWPLGKLNYVDFAGIDSGLAVMLREDLAQLMPHGGPRVVRKIIDALIALGCEVTRAMAARDVYPEAESELEAEMLTAVARAASPVAIDLLLRQPAIWHKMASDVAAGDEPTSDSIQSWLSRSRELNQLIAMPSVVVVGQPNVGKSTLTNRMLGRAASIVADLPGTTRDWVAGLAELPPGVAVRWMDTPGLRGSDDAIEQRAIALANEVIRAADVLVVMRDPQHDWPQAQRLPREPDVWAMNKCDTVSPALVNANEQATGKSPDTPRAISAQTGAGINELQRDILEKLSLHEIADDEPWVFSDQLREMITQSDWKAIAEFSSPHTSASSR